MVWPRRRWDSLQMKKNILFAKILRKAKRILHEFGMCFFRSPIDRQVYIKNKNRADNHVGEYEECSFCDKKKFTIDEDFLKLCQNQQFEILRTDIEVWASKVCTGCSAHLRFPRYCDKCTEISEKRYETKRKENLLTS